MATALTIQRKRQVTMPELAGFVTTQEAAEALNLHVETIREFLRDGTLEGLKVGYMWFVSKKAIEGYRKKTAGKDKHDPRRKN
jgi:excisionase family DNA binding protein